MNLMRKENKNINGIAKQDINGVHIWIIICECSLNMDMKEHWIGTQCKDTKTSMLNNYMIQMGGEVFLYTISLQTWRTG